MTIQNSHLGFVSAIAIMTAVLSPGLALAQSQGASQASDPGVTTVDEIVVTGSSIRGVAPVGSNLVSVGRETMESTAAINVTELTNTVPAISTAGAAPLGENVFSYYSPQIHSLAGSASNTTLVIADGLRMPGGGTQFAQTDPNIIPTSAILRVEVLADGASSVYGSDAVAGVVNYIMRPSFDGFEVSGKYGFGRDFESYDLNGIWGRDWGSGGVYVAAQYSDQSPLLNASRDFLSMGDYRPIGGRNVQTFNCAPATIRTPSSGNNVYLSPDATETVPNTADFAPCNNTIYGAAIQGNTRANILMRVRNEFTDRLRATVTLNYNHLLGSRPLGPGMMNNVVAFGPGSGQDGQINPFYVAPAGDPGATRQNISYAALRSDGEYGTQSAENDTLYLTTVVEYDITDEWSGKLSYALGRSRSSLVSRDAFCNACAFLALNGTAQAGGDPTRTNVPGYDIIALNMPLTPENALDVWSDPSGNRTSQSVIDSLYSQDTSTEHYNTFDQIKLEVQGRVLSLAAGDLRAAFGAEYMSVGQDVEGTNAGTIGSTAIGAQYRQFYLSRYVYSAYAEFMIPIISPEMNFPLAHSFDVNISGRYDKYQDVGSTSNPKIAANWEITSDFRLRGNYATAFVAPPMASIGIPEFGYQRSPTGANVSGAFFAPISNYPELKLLPGCETATVVCQIGTALNQGLSRSYGVGPDAKPQTGDSWSVGFDYQPAWLSGFNASVTYWSNTFEGGVNRPDVSQQLNSQALRHRLTLCPTGCTTAQIAEFVNSANGGSLQGSLPPTVYFLNNNDQGNLLNLRVQGIDAILSYTHYTENYGSFTVGGSMTYYTKFDQDFGDEEWSVLNTSGSNSTFPSVQIRGRFQAGWENGPVSVDAFVNYTGSYYNWNNSTVEPIILNANGYPVGGGDRIDASATLDLHASYDLSLASLDRASIFIDVKNAFDQDPPFYSGNTGGIGVGGYGYNGFVSNPLGRIISIGFRMAL